MRSFYHEWEGNPENFKKNQKYILQFICFFGNQKWLLFSFLLQLHGNQSDSSTTKQSPQAGQAAKQNGSHPALAARVARGRAGASATRAVPPTTGPGTAHRRKPGEAGRGAPREGGSLGEVLGCTVRFVRCILEGGCWLLALLSPLAWF